jgi:hypothetical protein
MNRQNPVIELRNPEVLDRRREPGRVIPTPATIRDRRANIAEALQSQLAPVKRRFAPLTAAQRRAFFVKLRHRRPISLVGTGLKAMSTVDDATTLAAPIDDDFQRLENKIVQFGHGEVHHDRVPNAALVGNLELIEVGAPTDRLSDDLRAHFEDYCARDFIKLEIEITSLESNRHRQRAEVYRTLETVTAYLGHGIGGVIYEHEYADGVIRVALSCNGASFRALVEDPDWQTKITRFEEQPTFQTYSEVLRDFGANELHITAPDLQAEVICIADSGLARGNPFLGPVTRDELMFSFLSQRPSDVYDENGHGSGVASLAAYYTLNLAAGADNTAASIIASARILDQNNECPDRLFSVVLRDVVEALLPQGVRIFNLSVNVAERPWNQTHRRALPKRSWTARAIDQIIREHDVLIVISTGNIALDDLRDLNRAAAYPRYFADASCALLDPGQAALALSVGAIAATTQLVGDVRDLTPLVDRDQPAPFTRCGPGIRGDIKPELVEYGGNVAINGATGSIVPNIGFSIPIASAETVPAVVHDIGTSLAAPKVAHQAARLLRDLRSLGLSPSGPLLRAFLVNSARHADRDGNLQNFIGLLGDEFPVGWQDIVGYGIANADRATYCDDYEVKLYYEGSLESNKVAIFDIPVPASLTRSPREAAKKLHITVAYNPEIHVRAFSDYFGTLLKWRLFRGDVAREDVLTAMSRDLGEDAITEEDDGVVEDAVEVNEMPGALGIRKRSRGSVQHDVFDWRDHQERYSAGSYTLAVTSFERWGRANPDPVPFAIVVSLEDESRSVAIYSEVRALVTAPITVRA